jgi:thioredoxin 1
MKWSPSGVGFAGVLLAMAGLAVLFGAGCQQTTISGTTYRATGTPRLVELGTGACIPCALMRPGLDELRQEYAGRLEVDVIDTLLHSSAKTEYNAPFCATQIYIASSGKELYRNVGFVSKEDILAKWKELGVDLGAARR